MIYLECIFILAFDIDNGLRFYLNINSEIYFVQELFVLNFISLVLKK